MTAVPADEIYEKYLNRAIAELNELWAEMRRAAGEDGIAVLPTGHALADVFLLKFRPRDSEVQEGIAFYGRAGEAIKKSLHRLHIDVLSVYGTNCLKLAGAPTTAEQAQAWLTRELHIVQPKLVVVMGEAALEFLNALEFPLADRLEPRPGDVQRFTPTVEALYAPDIDASLDEQAAKTTFWNAFKLVGSWWAELPPY